MFGLGCFVLFFLFFFGGVCVDLVFFPPAFFISRGRVLLPDYYVEPSGLELAMITWLLRTGTGSVCHHV